MCGSFYITRDTIFLSTPSGWRATLSAKASITVGPDFYPRPPGGGRRLALQLSLATGLHFYPRPPGGGRPTSFVIFCIFDDFYPRPPGGGRRPHLSFFASLTISIHALRVEGDRLDCEYLTASHFISIHALRVEGDMGLRISDCLALHFYPRPPGGGRLPRD